MTKNVNAKVIELITNTNAHLPCPVNSMTRFVADLGMDSLDLVETVMMLEDEFGIELDNEDALNTVVTVEDISKLIRQALANAGTNAVDPKFESLKSVVNIVDTAVAEISEGFIGQAAQGALHILTKSWSASASKRLVEFDIKSMHSNVEAVIDILRSVQIGLSGAPDAEFQMRTNLGLESPAFTPFDSTSFDDQMEWVTRIRRSYPDIGPKEAFRLAEVEYYECRGVLSGPGVSA
jgi:acyl carrier protein